MTTTTRRLTTAQLAEQFSTDLTDLAITFPAAAAEVVRVMNLTCPLAAAVNEGLVKQVTTKGRELLEDGARDLHAITDLMDTDTYQRLVKTSAWTVMWDWTRAPAGVAFL